MILMATDGGAKALKAQRITWICTHQPQEQGVTHMLWATSRT